jgi:hypothetical protein
MENWFGEKTHQVEPASLSAFGILIESRYGIASELVEMLGFAQSCAEKKLAHYVTRVFYDSKGGMCNFELVPTVKEGDSVADALLESALEKVGYFDWFDSVQYGKPMDAVISNQGA